MFIHLALNPIIFKIGFISIYWYGIMYLFAFFQFFVLGRIRIQKKYVSLVNLQQKELDSMLLYGMFAVIFGGRLGEVFFYHPIYYFYHPIKIFFIWEGGMSFHGGFLGVVIAMYFWSKNNNRNLIDVLDFIVPMIPLGYALGRLGNFINAELPGRVINNNVFLSVIWPNVVSFSRHPSPIYQMFVDGILVFVVLWWFSSKKRPPMAISGMFSLLYSFSRFLTEYFRCPDYSVLFFKNVVFSIGQILSIPIGVLGIIFLAKAYYFNDVKKSY